MPRLRAPGLEKLKGMVALFSSLVTAVAGAAAAARASAMAPPRPLRRRPWWIALQFLHIAIVVSARFRASPPVARSVRPAVAGDHGPRLSPFGAPLRRFRRTGRPPARAGVHSTATARRGRRGDSKHPRSRGGTTMAAIFTWVLLAFVLVTILKGVRAV